MTTKNEASGHPPSEIKEQVMVCLPELDIEQNRAIDKLRHDMELLEAGRGALNASSIRTILSIVGLGMTLAGNIAGMWLQNSTEPTRTGLTLLEQKVSTQIAQSSKSDIEIVALNGGLQELKDELSNTLTSADLEARFDALEAAIIVARDQADKSDIALDGKFTRLVTGRVEDDIQLLRDAVSRLETNYIQILKDGGK